MDQGESPASRPDGLCSAGADVRRHLKASLKLPCSVISKAFHSPVSCSGPSTARAAPQRMRSTRPALSAIGGRWRGRSRLPRSER
jgi:hypothetical protein